MSEKTEKHSCSQWCWNEENPERHICGIQHVRDTICILAVGHAPLTPRQIAEQEEVVSDRDRWVHFSLHAHHWPEHDRVRRMAMSPAEYWEDLYSDEGPEEPEIDIPDEIALESLTDQPCVVCGSTTACGYDNEGRAMIHTTEDDDS